MVQLPQDMAAQMPPGVQRLVGYGQAGGLGHANDKGPATLLGEGGAELIKENQELLKKQQQLIAEAAKAAKAEAARDEK